MSIFRKKSIRMPFLLTLISISLLFSNTMGVYMQQSFADPIPGLPSTLSRSIDSPTTAILQAIDGKNVDLCTGSPCLTNPRPTTTSTSITFVVSGTVSNTDLPIKRFECSLDNDVTFSSCASVDPAQTNIVHLTLPGFHGLAITSHTFKVRAVNTADIRDPNPSEFTWTITSNVTSTVTTITQVQNPTLGSNNGNVERAITEAGFQSLAHAERMNVTSENAKASTALNLVTAAQASTMISLALNPPLLKCATPNFDVSIYKIEGTANLRKLFENARGQTSVPIIFEMLENTNPQSTENMIVNKNNPFIFAKLIAYPGDINRQRVVDVELSKINTECKATALISSQEVTKPVGQENKPSQPPIIVPRLETVTLNPPFSKCIAATPNLPSPGDSKVTDSLTENTQENQQAPVKKSADVQTDLSSSSPFAQNSATATALALNPSLATALARNQTNLIVKSTSPTSSPSLFNANSGLAQLLGNTASGTATGGIPDVAKYVIRGKINTNKLIELNGNQKLVITMFVDLAPQSAPAVKSFNLGSSNLIAATMQASPATRDWGVTSLLLDEIYTACDTIPFVSRPMAIGDDISSDFSTQIVSDCAAKSTGNSETPPCPSPSPKAK